NTKSGNYCVSSFVISEFLEFHFRYAKEESERNRARRDQCRPSDATRQASGAHARPALSAGLVCGYYPLRPGVDSLREEPVMGRLLVFTCFFCAGIESRSAGPTKVVSIEGVTEYKFENGARALLFPEASRPTITINMTVLVGSRH